MTEDREGMATSVWAIFWADVLLKGLVTLVSLPSNYLVSKGEPRVGEDE